MLKRRFRQSSFLIKHSSNNSKTFTSPLIGWQLFLLVLVLFASGYSVGSLLRLSTKNQVLGISTQLQTEKIITLINLERAKHSLRALTPNEQLNRAAEQKGEFMINHNYWAHISPDGIEPWQFIHQQEYFYLSAGENLARDFNREEDLVAAWMASPTHRDNLLNSDFSQMGIAIVEGIIDHQPVILIVNFYAQPHQYQASSGGEVWRYNQADNNYYQSGEILLPKTQKAWLNKILLWQLLLFVTVGMCLAIVLVKLRQQPFGRRKKR